MINILDYIPFGAENRITRKELVSLLAPYCPGNDVDRWIRKDLIGNARKTHIIISGSKGYFQPILPDEEYYVRKYVAREDKRSREVYASAGAARKYIKMMAKKKRDYEYCGSVIDGR